MSSIKPLILLFAETQEACQQALLPLLNSLKKLDAVHIDVLWFTQTTLSSDTKISLPTKQQSLNIQNIQVPRTAFLPEALANRLYPLITPYTHVLTPSSALTKALLPRLAALTQAAILTDVYAILSPDQFQRKIYAGALQQSLQVTAKLTLMTVQNTGTQEQLSNVEKSTYAITTLAWATADLQPFQRLPVYKGTKNADNDHPQLATAPIVVTGGRGLRSAEYFNTLVGGLAELLGAAIGATRAVVDAGWVPNEYQVGQTGQIVAPQLYIAIGVSGAVQHLAGMRDSSSIIAINQDKEAPMVKLANYALIGDLFIIVPRLIELLRQK